MYKSFRIDVESICGRLKQETNKFDLNKLTTLFINDEPIDAEEVIKIIFPQYENTHIFISHSSKDIEKATWLANELKNKFGLNVFIDSAVWGSVYDLLKEIDNKYCISSDDTTYAYEKRNITTSNTFMILNSALIKMIDKAEVFLFVGSDNSLLFESTGDIIEKEKTTSPWIHSELLFSSMTRINTPKRIKLSRENFNDSLKSESAMSFIHPANTNHLKLIDKYTLQQWLEYSKKDTEALDYLYEITRKFT